MGSGPQDWLTVVQALPSSEAQVTYPLTQHTVVNGHQAAIGEDTENGRVDGGAITWAAGGYSLAVVSSRFRADPDHERTARLKYGADLHTAALT